MSTDKSAAAVRELVERWMGKKHPITMQSYVSDLTALISEHYYPKEKYDELLQQRDELREALISLMWQFAYYGTKNNVAVMHTGGLSALEDAFSALGLSDPITVENFEAAIKNTEKK